MESISKKHFLLGGKDLEMQEIEQLLISHNCSYSNASLSWHNAQLSQYANEISKLSESDIKIYGIELTEDITPPSNYIRIDHHNDFSNRSSSLIQVAEILNIKLNRHQQLVAINDVGYIPAMISFGASTEEINAIRFADRQAQGVTNEDEQLAIKAIGNLEKCNDLIIVKAQSSKFSPICDRLFPYKALLIYTDHELTYYGNLVPKLKQHFEEHIKSHKIYYGGNDTYIGISKNAFSPNEIINIISQIKQLHETL